MSESVSMSAAGAVIVGSHSNLGLLAAFGLPLGGMLCVDLLNPMVPVELSIQGEELTNDVRDYLIAYRSGERPALPTRWLRLVTVTGVDRWVDEAFDERLLAADRALALIEAGDHEGGLAAYTTAADRVLDYVTSLVAKPSAAPPAIVGELIRIAEAVGAVDLAGALRQIRLQTGRGFATESLRLAWRRGGPTASAQLLLVDVDHRQVPARMIDGTVQVQLEPGRLVATAQPHPGLRPDHPAANRLIARLIDIADNSVIRQRPFELIGSSFQASFDLDGRLPAEVTVDIADVFGVRPPRVDTAGRAQREALASAKKAYQIVRSALAAFRLDQRHEAAAREIAVARDVLASLPNRFLPAVSEVLPALAAAAEAIEWHRPEQAGKAYLSDGVRPLLAELDVAARQH